MKIQERDWKLFREKLPLWQENYIGRLNGEYIAILQKPANASENFFELEKRIRNDKRSFGVSARISRNNMFQIVVSLLANAVITIDDLKDFSDEFTEAVNFCIKNIIKK